MRPTFSARHIGVAKRAQQSVMGTRIRVLSQTVAPGPYGDIITETVLWDGLGRYTPAKSNNISITETIAGDLIYQYRYDISLPYDTPDTIRLGDIVEIVDTGMRLRIEHNIQGSFRTVTSLTCVEITSP